jgi:hypothetical protein
MTLGEALDGPLNANLARVTLRQSSSRCPPGRRSPPCPIITGIYGMNFRHMLGRSGGC